MFSISTHDQLRPGDVLHHPNSGFARVHRIDGPNIQVSWQARGHTEQRITRARDIQTGFRLCAPNGFMYLSVVDSSQLTDFSQDRAGYLLSLLLDDLGGPQSVMDVRQWMLGRSVLTPRAFQRWWKDLEPALSEHQSFVWDGTRLCSTQDDQIQSLRATEPTTLNSEFGQLRPVGRFRIFNDVDSNIRSGLMSTAIQGTDRDAILLLLRDSEITDDADGSVLALAMDDDADLAAALLLRQHEGAEMAFSAYAASREHRPFLRQIFSAIPGGYQSSVVLSLMDRALSDTSSPGVGHASLARWKLWSEPAGLDLAGASKLRVHHGPADSGQGSIA
jgi:hypothetical protein